VVGNDIPFFDASKVRSRPLTIWDMQNGVRLVDPPPGAFTFRFPKAVVNSKGRLYLFWGETSNPGLVEAFRWQTIPITSIWWATYDRESGWSKPEQVIAGSLLDWSSVTSAEALVGEDGDIAFALPGSSRQTRTLFRTTADRWHLTPIPAGGAYAHLAGKGEHLFFAYVDAAVGSRQSDVNSVFMIRSDNGGVTWKPPILVSRSGLLGAYELHLVSMRDGSLHLVWVQDNGNGSSVIRHVSSSNGGTRWSPPQDLPIIAAPGGASLAVSSDQCSGIHVLYQDSQMGPEDMRLGYAYWRSRWIGPNRLFPKYRVGGDAAFNRITDNRILVVFLAQKAGSEPKSAAWMLYSQGLSGNDGGLTHARQ